MVARAVSDLRRSIPSVELLLEAPAAEVLLKRWPRARVRDALRSATETERDRIAGVSDSASDQALALEIANPARYVAAAARALERADEPGLRGVINATGVVLHTNLGRAPLAAQAMSAATKAAEGYVNLEFDLERGVRGSRYEHSAALLRELTGAEDALVVNNCAAALVLAMAGLARGRSVIVSRGELVEIGGGFRIPEMLEQAGARLVEVGSTNRTRVADYRDALEREGDVAVLLKVHRANFRMLGFTEEASLDELVDLAHAHDVAVVHDVGSGLLVDPATLGLPPEPRPAESVRAGADLAVFSGDKLLGGPQAGLIVGREAAVDRLRKTPLCRALRVDKSTLAALESTLQLYRDPEHVSRHIPALRMLTLESAVLQARAEALATSLAAVTTGSPFDVSPSVMMGRVGGGTYPDHELVSWGVRITAPAGAAQQLATALRAQPVALVGRLEGDALLLDLRTVPEELDGTVAQALQGALAANPEGGA